MTAAGKGLSLVSWNRGSMTMRWPELFATGDWQVACLQETGATARKQRSMDAQLEARRCVAIWGKPTPM